MGCLSSRCKKFTLLFLFVFLIMLEALCTDLFIIKLEILILVQIRHMSDVSVTLNEPSKKESALGHFLPERYDKFY